MTQEEPRLGRPDFEELDRQSAARAWRVAADILEGEAPDHGPGATAEAIAVGGGISVEEAQEYLALLKAGEDSAAKAFLTAAVDRSRSA